MGLSITDPEKVYTFENPFTDYPLNSAPANKELKFLRVITDKKNFILTSFTRLTKAAAHWVAYPSDNNLADLLKIVARNQRRIKDKSIYCNN